MLYEKIENKIRHRLIILLNRQIPKNYRQTIITAQSLDRVKLTINRNEALNEFDLKQKKSRIRSKKFYQGDPKTLFPSPLASC